MTSSAALRPGIPKAAAGPEVKVNTPHPICVGLLVCAEADPIAQANNSALATSLKPVISSLPRLSFTSMYPARMEILVAGRRWVTWLTLSTETGPHTRTLVALKWATEQSDVKVIFQSLLQCDTLNRRQ